MNKGTIIMLATCVGILGLGGFAVSAGLREQAENEESLRIGQHNTAVALASAADYLGDPIDPVPTEPHDLAIGVENAQAGVRAQLRDGDSARWGAIWTVDGWNYCGFVNGKNAYGAYSGFKPFRAVNTRAEIEPSAETWKKYCVGPNPKIALEGTPSPGNPPA